MDYLVWLAIGGLSRNQGIRRLVFSNVDFGSGDGALFSDIMRTWLNQRASHYRIAFRSCRFGRLSHITALGKCLSTSNIVEIIFVGIDFGDTPPSLLVACLLRTNRKDAIRFVDCAMTSHQTQELIRVIPTIVRSSSSFVDTFVLCDPSWIVAFSLVSLRIIDIASLLCASVGLIFHAGGLFYLPYPTYCLLFQIGCGCALLALSALFLLSSLLQ